MLDMNSVKRDIKAELKPRKMIRRALVPQFGGLMAPLKEVFSLFVRTIGLLFVQAKLIPANHPAMTGDVKGIGAIWLMILDGSKDLKFTKQNANQLFVFYAVVGMLVFGVLSALTFVMKMAFGTAHAQGTGTGAGSGLFSEQYSVNASNWLNCLFAPASNGTCPNGTNPIVTALTSMLTLYNTGLLVLASIFALWSLMSMIVESGHHGQWGGTRHNALYAPLRIVLAIGMLVPLGNGYNAIENIVVLIAHAGSGLAGNLWYTFQQQLAKGLQEHAQPTGSSDWNNILENLVVDETCMYATQYLNPPNGGTNTNISVPTSFSQPIAQIPLTAVYTDPDSAATAFTINFDRTPGDAYCGTLTVSSQNSQLISGAMTPNQFITAMQPVLSSIWSKVAQNIIANGGAVNYDPTKNPLVAGNNNNYPWGTQGQQAQPGTLEGDAAGPNGTFNTALTAIFNKYNTSVLTPITSQQPTTSDWTTAGFVFLQWAHVASDMYTVLNPTVSVSLPNSEIMPSSSNAGGQPPQCSKESWGQWLGLAAKPYVCTTQGAGVAMLVNTSIQDAKYGMTAVGLRPQSYAPGSVGDGNDGGILSDAMNKILLSLESGFTLFNINSTASNNSNGSFNSNSTSLQYSTPAVGQSLFNTLYLGQLIMNTAAVMFGLAAIVGMGLITAVAGQILAAFAAMLFPVGAMLAIMIPLLPAIRFFFGIMTWLMTIFEALVAMPVVMLWSLRTDGEGLFAHGQQGYLCLLQMMLRPVLMLFGLIGSVLIFDTLAGFLNQTVFSTWNNNWASANYIDQFLSIVGFLYFYITVLYSAANISFGLINGIPDRVLSWIGTGLSIRTSGDSVAERAGQAVGSAMMAPTKALSEGAAKSATGLIYGAEYGAFKGIDYVKSKLNPNEVTPASNVSNTESGSGDNFGGNMSGAGEGGNNLPPSGEHSSLAALGYSDSTMKYGPNGTGFTGLGNAGDAEDTGPQGSNGGSNVPPAGTFGPLGGLGAYAAGNMAYGAGLNGKGNAARGQGSTGGGTGDANAAQQPSADLGEATGRGTPSPNGGRAAGLTDTDQGFLNGAGPATAASEGQSVSGAEQQQLGTDNSNVGEEVETSVQDSQPQDMNATIFSQTGMGAGYSPQTGTPVQNATLGGVQNTKPASTIPEADDKQA